MASKVTAVAVVTSALGVLLVERRDGVPPWSFPGGTVEAGESAEDAAVRETLEETGLVVEASGVIGERRHPRTGRDLVYVAAVPVGGTDVHVADPVALSGVRWVRLDELGELLPDLFVPVAEHLRRSG